MSMILKMKKQTLLTAKIPKTKSPRKKKNFKLCHFRTLHFFRITLDLMRKYMLMRNLQRLLFFCIFLHFQDYRLCTFPIINEKLIIKYFQWNLNSISSMAMVRHSSDFKHLSL